MRDVDHQPALLELQIAHRWNRFGANDTVGAVAAQHVVGVDGVLAAVGAVGERDADATIALILDGG